MQVLFGWVRAGLGWIEIAGGIILSCWSLRSSSSFCVAGYRRGDCVAAAGFDVFSPACAGHIKTSLYL